MEKTPSIKDEVLESGYSQRKVEPVWRSLTQVFYLYGFTDGRIFFCKIYVFRSYTESIT